MFRHRLTAGLIGLLPVLTIAAAKPAQDPAAAERIHAAVAFLADDLLEGRAAGTRGYDIAAHFVATQFQLLGLKPGGAKGQWFQPIDLIEATSLIPEAGLSLDRDGQTVTLNSSADFLPGLDYHALKSSVTGEPVFVGFGVHAPELKHDDFANVDLKGRIAVVLSGGPPTFPSESRAHHAAGLTKNAELVRHGAIGVITVRTPGDEKRVPWERLVQSSWRPGMRWIGSDGQPVDAWPELKRTATLSPEGAAKLFAGASKSLEQVFADAEQGRVQDVKLPGRVTLSGQTLHNRRESTNVVGILEGDDPVLKHEYVVLSAHLDGLGRGAAVNGDAIYNGALDNATGVAVMLEVARSLRASPERLKRSVIFVAVTAEERGLLGSDVFARNPMIEGGRIVADINMDMPVMLAPTADLVAVGAEHSSLGPIAARAAAAENFALTPDPTPEENIFVRSDQYMFVRQGVPSIFLCAGIRSRDPNIDLGSLAKEFRDHRYHMPSDDLSQSIHYPSLAGLARVNVRIVREVANAAARPSWNPGDFFGERFSKKP